MTPEEKKARVEAMGKRVIAVIVWTFLVWNAQREFAKRWQEYDFTDNFYTAGRMVLEGHRHDLYNVAMQRDVQIRLMQGEGVIFCYPSPVALMYAGVAFLPVVPAHLLWNVFAVGLFLLCAYSLNRALALDRDWFADFGLFCAYAPVYFNLLQGQIDVVVLTSFLLGFWALKEKKEFLAGLALSLGLIKFQLMIPFLLILLFRKKWRTIAAASLGGAVLFLFSIAVSGVRSVADYIHLLRSINTIPNAIVDPRIMANLRGLYYTVTHHEMNAIVLGVLSIALLYWASRKWPDLESGFSIAMVASILVSYHTNAHSLVLALPALAVLAKRVARLGWMSYEGLALFLAAAPFPMMLTVWAHRSAWMAIPLAFVPVVLRYSQNSRTSDYGYALPTSVADNTESKEFAHAHTSRSA